MKVKELEIRMNRIRWYLKKNGGDIKIHITEFLIKIKFTSNFVYIRFACGNTINERYISVTLHYILQLNNFSSYTVKFFTCISGIFLKRYRLMCLNK